MVWIENIDADMMLYSTMGFALAFQGQFEQGKLSRTDVRVSLLYGCQASWNGKFNNGRWYPLLILIL